MKHRSVVIFFVVVMALAGVPQVSQQLLDLKVAAADRISKEVWNVFLSMHGQRLETVEVAKNFNSVPDAQTEMACATNRTNAGGAKAARARVTRERAANRNREAADVDTPSEVLIASVPSDKGLSDTLILHREPVQVAMEKISREIRISPEEINHLAALAPRFVSTDFEVKGIERGPKAGVHEREANEAAAQAHATGRSVMRFYSVDEKKRKVREKMKEADERIPPRVRLTGHAPEAE